MDLRLLNSQAFKDRFFGVIEKNKKIENFQSEKEEKNRNKNRRNTTNFNEKYDFERMPYFEMGSKRLDKCAKKYKSFDNGDYSEDIFMDGGIKKSKSEVFSTRFMCERLEKVAVVVHPKDEGWEVGSGGEDATNLNETKGEREEERRDEDKKNEKEENKRMEDLTEKTNYISEKSQNYAEELEVDKSEYEFQTRIKKVNEGDGELGSPCEVYGTHAFDDNYTKYIDKEGGNMNEGNNIVIVVSEVNDFDEVGAVIDIGRDVGCDENKGENIEDDKNNENIPKNKKKLNYGGGSRSIQAEKGGLKDDMTDPRAKDTNGTNVTSANRQEGEECLEGEGAEVPTKNLIVEEVTELLAESDQKKRQSKWLQSHQKMQNKLMTITKMSVLVIVMCSACNLFVFSGHLLFYIQQILISYKCNLAFVVSFDYVRRFLTVVFNLFATFKCILNFLSYCLCSNNFRSICLASCRRLWSRVRGS